MCSIIALLVLVVSGLFGYSMASSQQTISEPQTMEVTAEVAPIPTQAISCATQAVSQDLSEMGAVVDAKIFEPTLWTMQNDVGDGRTTMTWRSDKLGAVAYLEYLHWDCGVSSGQIDQYFSPQSFESIWSNYSSYTQTAFCQQNDLRLFEFDATFNENDYQIRYWVEPVTPTRVADLALTFPADQQAKMAQYAGHLFPDLPTCTGAAG